jgi:hypothetical protein
MTHLRRSELRQLLRRRQRREDSRHRRCLCESRGGRLRGAPLAPGRRRQPMPEDPRSRTSPPQAGRAQGGKAWAHPWWSLTSLGRTRPNCHCRQWRHPLPPRCHSPAFGADVDGASVTCAHCRPKWPHQAHPQPCPAPPQSHPVRRPGHAAGCPG